MYESKVKLSKRMEAIYDMVSPELRVCDVGCDHAFIDIALVKSGKCKEALAMDVNEGPLYRANEHINEAGLENKIHTRLSDGLKKFQQGEAEALIISGMGGALISRIISDDMDKSRSFLEMILSPQSEIMEFRIFLSKNGFMIADENMVYEDGKYYVIIKIANQNTSGVMLTNEKLSDEELYAGPVLLRKKHEVLISYLEKELNKKNGILCKLKMLDDKKNTLRCNEIEGEIKLIKRALARMGMA